VRERIIALIIGLVLGVSLFMAFLVGDEEHDTTIHPPVTTTTTTSTIPSPSLIPPITITRDRIY